MNFSKRTKYLLLGLLVSLNFVIRIPSVPHEIGNDSFGIHILANSISSLGYAKWWVTSLSVFGMYPYSYASSVPFILSGISQCTGVDMELVIWIYCVIIGIFSAFTAYLLAGAIWDDDVFKLLVAFAYSISSGILIFSTWDATTRGLFMVVLPLFIYLLLKIRVSVIKYAILTLIAFTLLIATHHFFLLLIPIVFSLIIVTTFDKLKRYIKFKISEDLISISLIIGFIGVLLIPFFTGIFIKWGRYDELHWMLRNNVRYTGALIIFAFSGIIYLIFKHNKRFEEWFLLLATLSLVIFLYMETYIHYFIIIFACIFIGIALTNVSRVEKQKRKYAALAIVIFLSLSIVFSGFYQHWRTHQGGVYGDWYLDEGGYAGAVWIKENVDMNKKLVGNDNLLCKRMSAISGVPTLLKDVICCMFVYGFADINTTPIVKRSPLSISYYKDNPYAIHRLHILPGWYRNTLQGRDVDSQAAKGIIRSFDLAYFIENQNIGRNKFISSLYTKKDNVYDNGNIRVWAIEEN